MKALSIKQPWAWAIIHAGKDIENRDWFTRLRGKIVVHASKGLTKDEFGHFNFTCKQTPGLAHAYYEVPNFHNLIRGAIIGTVEIIDCVKKSDSPWFFGDYGFVLRNPQPLEHPIYCKGALGFWDVPAEISREIAFQKSKEKLSMTESAHKA